MDFLAGGKFETRILKGYKFGNLRCLRAWKFSTPGVDPSILQTALLQVAEATKAASEAAKAASVAQQKATTSSGGATSVDWSKLFNRPPVFEHATTEAEIKGFRDWSWQVCQYLATIDANYDEEVKKLFDDPSKGFDMSSASVETRTRSTKLYGLLASLVRGKSLNTIKSIGNSDGYEALRQMSFPTPEQQQ